jgi:hypothetical protein
MADNVTLPGTGAAVASDDVSGVHFQKVKLDGGGDGASAPITGDTANGLDVDVTRIQAGENHLGEVGGKTVVVSANFTRPGNTTQYTAGDAVTDSTSAPSQITFSGAARINGGSGVILAAIMVDSVNPGTKPQLELWLFDSSVTPDNDNSAFTPTDAECGTLIGVIPFNAWYVGDSSSNAVAPVHGLSIPFKCGGGSASLFGLLVVRNAYTPSSAEVFTIRLSILQD